MNDRELLELAAKAAGIELVWSSEQDMTPMIKGVTGNSTRCWFSPLTDDGDALRLAVKLGILDMHSILNEFICEEQRHFDRPTSTRRAITRVAAELGKEMK